MGRAPTDLLDAARSDVKTVETHVSTLAFVGDLVHRCTKRITVVTKCSVARTVEGAYWSCTRGRSNRPKEEAMHDETARTLLDRAEADFRAELAEIEQTMSPLRPIQDDVGEMNGSGQHPADLASETVEREVASGLLTETEAVLVEIEAARRRLAVGGFGRCETCGRDIDPERLTAIPWARRCASDESHVESTWQTSNIDEASIWHADTAGLESTAEDSAWDPEDDHPVLSTEELAIHELSPRSGS